MGQVVKKNDIKEQTGAVYLDISASFRNVLLRINFTRGDICS
jgi:hypothetical protein